MNTNTKPWWQSKTLWAAILTAFIGLWDQIQPIIPDSIKHWAIPFLGILNAIFRLTSSSALTVNNTRSE